MQIHQLFPCSKTIKILETTVSVKAATIADLSRIITAYDLEIEQSLAKSKNVIEFLTSMPKEFIQDCVLTAVVGMDESTAEKLDIGVSSAIIIEWVNWSNTDKPNEDEISYEDMTPEQRKQQIIDNLAKAKSSNGAGGYEKFKEGLVNMTGHLMFNGISYNDMLEMPYKMALGLTSLFNEHKKGQHLMNFKSALVSNRGDKKSIGKFEKTLMR